MRFQTLIMVTLLGAIVGPTSGARAADAKPLSAADMIAQGEGVAQSAAELSETVNGLIREATDDGDMMKVTCLNDKLTEIDGHLASVQQHLQDLRKAADADTREHEHTMIMVVKDKLAVLSQQAGQCVGKDLYETGETKVDSYIDPNLASNEGDPAAVPTILPPSLPTLPPASSGMR